MMKVREERVDAGKELKQLLSCELLISAPAPHAKLQERRSTRVWEHLEQSEVFWDSVYRSGEIEQKYKSNCYARRK